MDAVVAATKVARKTAGRQLRSQARRRHAYLEGAYGWPNGKAAKDGTRYPPLPEPLFRYVEQHGALPEPPAPTDG